MATIHILQPKKVKRTRAFCPYHKQMEYATRQDYYDGSYFHFDCGTNMNQGEWTPPPKTKCHLCRKQFSPIEMEEHLMNYHRVLRDNLFKVK